MTLTSILSVFGGSTSCHGLPGQMPSLSMNQHGELGFAYDYACLLSPNGDTKRAPEWLTARSSSGTPACLGRSAARALAL
jgi:hypothetical protein